MAEHESEKPIYVSIPGFTKAEMEQAVADNNIEKLIYVPLFASLYFEDSNFAEKICIKLADHSNDSIRGNAIEGFEHIARIDENLNEEIVKPIITKALKDESEFIRDKAEWTRDYTKQFLKWKYKNARNKRGV